MFASCQRDNPSILQNGSFQIESAKENPCILCTQRIQAELAVCLQNAGNDQAKIKACNAKASSDWVAQCSAICKPSIENKPSPELIIESAKDNQCIQCTQKIQAELAVCLQNAGNDQAKIKACKVKASSDWVTQCSAICKPK